MLQRSFDSDSVSYDQNHGTFVSGIKHGFLMQTLREVMTFLNDHDIK
jgi:hypothetical protein